MKHLLFLKQTEKGVQNNFLSFWGGTIKLAFFPKITFLMFKLYFKKY